MNIYGWTSWGWAEDTRGGKIRRWKWHGREDLFIETNDDHVLLIVAGRLEEDSRS